MKLLVTGGAGFIGSALVHHLAEHGVPSQSYLFGDHGDLANMDVVGDALDGMIPDRLGLSP